MVDMDRNIVIEYTGTPPNKQRFYLTGEESQRGFKVTIYYPNAGAYSIRNSAMQLIDTNDWDNDAQTWGEPTGAGGCGENRYEGVINRLEFWMNPGCDLYIVPRDALMLGIRMEWTMDEFFADGGTTTFADRLAGILGIH